MATRYGWQTQKWLVERGWKTGVLPDGICGDVPVIDPQTGKQMTVYEAARLHRERTGEYP